MEKRFYTGTNDWKPYTRDQWLQLVAQDSFKVQPPDYWLISQADKGRSVSAASSIWHRNYPGGRKFVIWDQAPEEDFRARGYLR